jgi:hypothetical protein
VSWSAIVFVRLRGQTVRVHLVNVPIALLPHLNDAIRDAVQGECAEL